MKGAYDVLPTADEDQPFLPGISKTRRQPFRNKSLILSLVSNVALLAAFITLALFQKPSDVECLRRTNSYSPALYSDEVIPLGRKMVNATLFPASQPPEFWRQSPNPQLDQAWVDLVQTPVFLVSEDDVLKMGRDPSKAVHVPESYHLSPDGSRVYFAQLYGQHALHCLDVLRKFAYFDHYFGDKYNSTDHMPIYQQNHLNHCTEILRQDLMCSISTDIVLYSWEEGDDNPQPDFSVAKVCRSYDHVRGWLDRESDKVHLTEEQDFHVPRPAPGTYYEAPANPHWMQLVKEAREHGMDVHEYY